MYSASADLLLLALKAYQAGDVKSSAKMFASAASIDDVCVVERLLNDNNSKGVNTKLKLQLTAASKEFVEDLLAIDPEELNKAIKRHQALLVKHRTAASETLDMSEEDEVQEIDDDEFEEDYQPVSDTKEVDVETASLREGIKTALSVMKNRIDDWEVLNLLPIIIKMLPELFMDEHGNFRRDKKIDLKRARAILNIVLAHIDLLDAKKQQALYNVTRNVVME